MSKISVSDVQKVASLSGLVLSDEQVSRYQRQFEEILSYIDQLAAVDSSGLEPTYQVHGLHSVMRDDIIIDYGLSRDQLLANAPLHQDGQIKVRRVLG